MKQYPHLKPRPLYRLWLRSRRHFLTLGELSECDDITLGELAIITAAAKQSGAKV